MTKLTFQEKQALLELCANQIHSAQQTLIEADLGSCPTFYKLTACKWTILERVKHVKRLRRLERQSVKNGRIYAS